MVPYFYENYVLYIIEVYRACTNKFSQLFISRSWEPRTRAMWYVSTLLGLIRHAYWWGDKKWEKTLKSSACSHWMDSRVTSTQPTVRLWRNLYISLSHSSWCKVISSFPYMKISCFELIWYHGVCLTDKNQVKYIADINI